MRILAIDLGKFRSTAVLGVDSRRPEKSFRDFPTSIDAIRDLVVRTEPDLVVIEICPLAGCIADMLAPLGRRLAVINTCDERFLRRDAKAKTDLRDAVRLLDLAHDRADDLPTVFMPDARTRQWRRMITYRSTLQRRLVTAKNSLRSVFFERGVHLPAERRAWSKAFRAELAAMVRTLDGMDRPVAEADLAQIGLLERQLAEHSKALDAIAAKDERVALVRTVFGVGARVAEAFVAWIVDPKRFRSAKQVGAYLGLAPRVADSGETSRHGPITKAGAEIVRWLLVQAAWMAVRKKDSWARRAMERIAGGSRSRRRVAVTAVARQLAVRMWAMMRDGTEWREPEDAACGDACAAS